MVQLEVAERLTAGPGSRVYGVPSVKLAWHADARIAGRIGRRVFWPAPHVDSALVAMRRREPPGDTDRRLVFDVVDAAFAQRRKMLRSSLAGLAEPAVLSAALAAASVEPTKRAEQLGVSEFVRIANALRSADT
jgi:16S rRNA (adenine1518-N6/adenine1519-N6)-dimethyltransferase